MTGVQTCALPICFPVTIQNGKNDKGNDKKDSDKNDQNNKDKQGDNQQGKGDGDKKNTLMPKLIFV